MGKGKPTKMTVEDARRVQSAVDAKKEPTPSQIGFKARAMAAAEENEGE